LGLQADADELEAITWSDRTILAERGGWDDGREAEDGASEGGILQERTTVEFRHRIRGRVGGRGRGRLRTGVMGETFRGKEGLGFEDKRAGGQEDQKRYALKGRPDG
jgi:hypothetical protein